MKKFFKYCLSMVLAIAITFTLVACKKNVSETTVDLTKVKTVSEQTTNGGITVVRDGYLYFINGTKDNDGTNATGNKKSAICRVRYDVDTGKTSGDIEVVVDDLVGYEFGSINFFGDYMYYTTPSSSVNYKDDVLYYQTKFMRYDLANNTKSNIYTTKLNDEDETISYSYYTVNDDLYLIVFEKTNATLTSLKIGSSVETVYVIDEVKSCVMSESYGVCQTNGQNADANSFVFYTKEQGMYDKYQSGVKVYRTTPNADTSSLISDNGKSVSLMCIRSGKLVYSVEDNIYSDLITGKANETLSYSIANAISHQSYDNLIFMQNCTIDDSGENNLLNALNGNTCVLFFDSDQKEINVLDWINVIKIKYSNITVLNTDKISMIGIATFDVEKDNDDSEETTTTTVKTMYLIYSVSNIVYKLEIAKVVDEKMVISEFSEPIKLSTTTIKDANEMLAPEIIGKYLFVFAEKDNNTYLYQIDLTPEEDVTTEATKIALVEE